MEASFFFRMGSSHTFCQDYALAGVLDGTPYAVLSDGCSGLASDEPGAPFTDFGARFLVRAATAYLGSFLRGTFSANALLLKAHSMTVAAMLPDTALDATFMLAHPLGDSVRVLQFGDGVIAYRNREGGIYYRTCHFDNNAPYYLRYLLKQEYQETYHAFVQGLTETVGVFSPGKGWTRSSSRMSVDEGSFEFLVKKESVETLLIMSDGAESFRTKGGQAIPLETVLEHLFEIRSFKGEFVARRCKGFQKFCQAEGWEHTDDLSVAGIHLE